MGLFHFDIGGFTTKAALNLVNLTRSKELLLRSAEFATFTPVMRTHEGIKTEPKLKLVQQNSHIRTIGNQPAANHQVYSDDDTWKQFARLTQIFRHLGNYSRAAIKQNANDGIPVMRPLFLHYENDSQSFSNNYEYMYGDDLLVAPVLHLGRVRLSVFSYTIAVVVHADFRSNKRFTYHQMNGSSYGTMRK